MSRVAANLFAGVGAVVLLFSATGPADAQRSVTRPPPPAVPSAAPVSPRDSVRTVLAALSSLRMLQGRLNQMEEAAQNALGFFNIANGFCEIGVADYCYGPRNGGVYIGGIGTWPVKRRYEMIRFRNVDENRINAMINLYIDSVRSYLRRIPNERWLNNELIRLDLDRGYFVRAYENLARCNGDIWWCGALRGHTMVVAGVRERSDTIWEAVLTAMPPHEKCAWLDPTWVSDDKSFNKTWKAASCAERTRIAERVWWLSDPLYSVPGNERRSEHLARYVELMLGEAVRRVGRMTPAMMLRSKKLPTDSTILAVLDPRLQLKYAPWLLTYRWGFTEIVMRLGPPHYTTSNGAGQIVALYPYPRVAFVPDAGIFLNHLHAKASDWSLHDPFAFEFVTGWTKPIRELPHQIAWFRRGDSALVIATTDIRGDSVLNAAVLQKNLLMQRDYDQPMTQTTATGAGGIVRFEMRAVPESTLASIELLSRDGTAGRARTAAGPPPMPRQRVTLSDIMFVDLQTNGPRDLEEATARAAGTATVPHASTISIFWEMYGLAPGEKPRMAVVATRQRGSLLGGLLRAITSRSGIDSLSVVWEEPPVEGRVIEPRSVNLVLSSLAAGDYTIAVAAEVEGQQRILASRALQIMRPPRR